MNTQSIHIGPGTDIDISDMMQSRVIIQGNSGAGKSGLARKMMEEIFGKVPFVVWDIEGEYYTLKELSGDIVVIGGLHGDVPISSSLAEKLPRFIIDNRLTVVVDLSDMKMSDRVHFTKEFFETLMDLPLSYWVPYQFYLEECHKLAGEQDKQESSTAIKDLMQRGRKRGFCGIVMTQRIGMLSKSVSAECNNKFIGRTSQDIDMDRSGRELGFRKAKDALQLRELKRGHFFAFGPSIKPDHVHEVIVDKPKTTMVRAGMNIDFKAPRPTAKMLEMLTKLGEATPETVAGKNIPQNQDESEYVSVLTDQLNQTKAYVFELQNEIVELERLKTEYAKSAVDRGVRLTKLYQLTEDHKEAIYQFIDLLKEQVTEDLPAPTNHEQKQQPTFIAAVGMTGVGKTYRNKSGGAITSGDGAHTQQVLEVLKKQGHPMFNGQISGGERLILIAAAQYPNGLERYQFTILVGYKQSARDTYISRLKQKGYVEQSGTKIVATAAGKKALGEDYQPLPVGRKLAEYWLNRLSGGEQKILQVALRYYPQTVSRDQISMKTNYKQSARDTYISRLMGRELITIPSKGQVRASEFLFD